MVLNPDFSEFIALLNVRKVSCLIENPFTFNSKYDYMNYKDRIVSDYRVMLGKPVIKGTRITVELILKKFSEGAVHHDILEMYPHLQAEDVIAALTYASEVVANEEVIELQK